MLNYLQKKYLRSWVDPDRMASCQSLLVATFPEHEGGYQWR
jgi:hypothetical protein